MKVIALGFILILTACAQSNQVITTVPIQAPPPPVVTEPAVSTVMALPPVTDSTFKPSASATPATTPSPTSTTPAPVDSITEKKLEKAQTGKTLLEVIRAQGVPDDNIIPARKEQIAVYQLRGKYQFFFFKESQLVSQGEYPLSTIEKMKQDNLYPQAIIQDLNRL